MLDQLINQLQTKVETTGNLPDATRAELLKQAELLKTQAAHDEQEGEGDGENHEAQEGASGLMSSIEGLEASHPEITSLVNRIAITLGNMGI